MKEIFKSVLFIVCLMLNFSGSSEDVQPFWVTKTGANKSRSIFHSAAVTRDRLGGLRQTATVKASSPGMEVTKQSPRTTLFIEIVASLS